MDLLQTGEQLPPVPAWTSRSKNNEQQPTATARSDRPNFGALQALFNIEPLTSSDEHGTGTVANTAEQQHQEEEEINFDAVDRETLTQFINSFDAEQFRKATRFISGKEGAFKKCALPKNETGSCSQVKASPSFSNNNSFTEDSLNRLIRELTYMSEEEELEALKMMTQHRQCSQFHFDFASLGSDQKCVERFLAKAQKKFPIIFEGRGVKGGRRGGKVARFVRMMRRSKSRRSWQRLVLRARLYQQYFVNRLFNSANCIITCWLLCFCASLFH